VSDDLRNLIRIYEWEVDEKRRALGELLRVVRELEGHRDRLLEELRSEQQIALSSPDEAAWCFSGYIESVIQQRERIAQAVEDTDRQIAAAQEGLADAYRELKKFEIAQENRDKSAERELNRKEQAILDEVGMNSYQRKKAKA